MRRYGEPPPVNTVPGAIRRQDVQLAGDQPPDVVEQEPLPECIANWTLQWAAVDPSSLSADKLTAYALVTSFSEPIGPWGWVAEMVGEICDCEPEWAVVWSGATLSPEVSLGVRSAGVAARVNGGGWLESIGVGTLTIRVTCGDQTQAVALEIAEQSGGGYY